MTLTLTIALSPSCGREHAFGAAQSLGCEADQSAVCRGRPVSLQREHVELHPLQPHQPAARQLLQH
eukprot:scaffold42558_cov36-Phaeocystis_antarctica.AAC.1